MNTTEIPTYVEFNGIPGTGKTTLTSALIDKLEEQNYKIFDLNEVYFYQEEMKKSNIITSIKAIIFNPGISLKAFELLYKSKVNGEKIKYLIKILKLHYQLKKFLKII